MGRLATRPTRFDWDDCRRLRDEGWTQIRLAAHFGVSQAAVSRVLNIEKVRPKEAERRQRYYAACCEDCGGRASVNWAERSEHNQRRLNEGVLCRRCSGTRRREATLLRRINPDGDILCSKCGQHRPPDRFRDTRGFPKEWCKDCETVQRRAHRQAHPEIERAAYERQKARRRARRTART